MRIVISSLVLILVFLAPNSVNQILAQERQSLPVVEGSNDHFVPGGPPSRVTGQLVVKFRRGVAENVIEALNTTLGAQVLKVHPRSGFRRLGFPAGANLPQILAAFKNSPIVEEAGYNYIVRAFAAPNDEYYQPYQWHLHNTVGGMWAEQAWDETPNAGQGVVVAVIDTGVAYENFGPYVPAPDLDLSSRIVAPKDFYENDDHPNDDNGHGTHVTGTIAQNTNNNLATAGVAYNASIMPLKVLGYDGSGTADDLNEALHYATDNGAHVINMSLGFPNSGSPNGSGQVCTEIPGLNAALQYAYDNGVVVVGAAGNDGGTVVNCPAAYPTVIAVGATRYDGQRSGYSTRGNALDVAAPGGDMSVDQNGDAYGDGVLQVTFCYDASSMWLYYNFFGTNLYTEFCSVFYQGTSMATPHVTATAALILGENPGSTPDEVRNFIESTARDYGTPGWDTSYGWGVINAAAAVLAAQGGTPPSPPPPPPSPPTTGSVQGVVTDESDGTPIGGAKVTVGEGKDKISTMTANDGSYLLNDLPLGTYDVTASAKGYSSNTVSSSLTAESPDAALDFALAAKSGGGGGGKGGKGRP